MNRDCRWGILAASLITVVLAGGGCSRSPATGRMQMVLVSTEQEIALGEKALPEALKKFGGRVPNEKVQAYIAGVGERLVAVAEREMPYEFIAVSTGTPNAFALPGGKIFVTAGLLQHLRTERQLAAVLGHEIGHVTDRHNIIGMQRDMGSSAFQEIVAVVAGADGAEAARIGAKVVGSFTTLSYSRQDEYQADELAIRYLVKAGYDPWAIVEMLSALGEVTAGGRGGWSEMFGTHPGTGKRLRRVKEILREQYDRTAPDRLDPHAGRYRKMLAELKSTSMQEP